MRLHVNGEERELPEATTVERLLEVLAIKAARVAVEVNTAVVKKADYGSRVLQPGDAVEIVAFVGGG
jgi:sulfur carrier protein